jgi:radical SAM superfamily enzyme YgiQ (UPF0313 family)
VLSGWRRPIVLYNPRSEGHILPLALVHLGSMFPGRAVHVIDGRVEVAPETRVAEACEQAVCLGVTVMTGAPILDALRVTRAARARRPDLPVVWGGWHPSVLPEQCLASGVVDACVIGQGERTFLDVVEALEGGGSLEGLAGVAFLRKGEVVKNAPRILEDVNRFPPADFALLDMETHFRSRGGRRLDYCSSRSCPFPCPFCADPKVDQQRWSGLRAERVVAELSCHAERWRLTEVHFGDDNFFTDLGRVEAVASGLLQARTRFAWAGAGRADMLRRLSDGQLRLLRESGLRRVDVSAESGNRQVLESTRQGTLVEEVIETAEKLKRAGIGGRFCFVAGFPGEPEESLTDTYRAVQAIHRIDPSFETPIHIYAPYPGTELSSRMPTPGFEPPRRLEDWEHVDLEHSVGPWVSRRVRTTVPRYNFYLRQAHGPRQRGLAQRLLRGVAKLRVWSGYYGLDLEHRAADWVKRLSGAPASAQPSFAED